MARKAVILFFLLPLTWDTATFGEETPQENSDKSAKIEAYRRRAQAYLEQFNFEKAIDDFSTVIHLCPNDPKAYRDRAEAYYQCVNSIFVIPFESRRKRRQEDYPRAIADYNEVLRLQPGVIEFHSKRAELYLGTGNYDKAIADCTYVLRRQPRNARAYQIRLICYRNKQDYDRAIADCTAFIQLAPHDPSRQNWYGERAELYESKGDNARALADYTKMIQLHTNDPRLYLACRYRERAAFFLRIGEFDRSLADCASAIRIAKRQENTDTCVANLCVFRAGVHLRKSDLDAAEADFTTAIALDTHSKGDHYVRRAWVRYCRGNHAKALIDCEQAANCSDYRLFRPLARAALLLILGEYQQAIGCFTPRSKSPEGMQTIPTTSHTTSGNRDSFRT